MSEGSKGLNFCYVAVDFTGSQRILYMINLGEIKQITRNYNFPFLYLWYKQNRLIGQNVQ